MNAIMTLTIICMWVLMIGITVTGIWLIAKIEEIDVRCGKTEDKVKEMRYGDRKIS